MSKSKGESAKKVILSIAIAIVLVSFIGIGVNVFLEDPQWDDYCYSYDKYSRMELNSQESCEAVNGTWEPYDRPLNQEDAPEGYCDAQATCREQYEEANEKHSKNVFVIEVVLGLLIVIASLFLKSAISPGLMGGGVLTLFMGIVQYWSYSTDVIRFVILGLVLVVLLWVGIKKLK